MLNLKDDIVVHHHYNQDHHGSSSASHIVGYLEQALKIVPHSVIDVGCGLGQWLHIFSSKSASKVKGVDGYHVPSEKSFIAEEIE
jgi:2-polyprenyl-3-methyl-5-hydroxy-6-metoxy-1,4-benzoquinol methylase